MTVEPGAFTLIDEARDSIGPDGDLSFAARRSVQRVLVGKRSSPHPSLTAWPVLEGRSAQQVSLIWLDRFPDGADLAELLERATAGGQPTADRQVRWDGWRTQLDDRLLLGPEVWTSVYAGLAAWTAMRTLWHPLVRGSAAPELATDPGEWDASFYASLALAGGATWEDGVGDPLRRAQFWTWYLDAALEELA